MTIFVDKNTILKLLALFCLFSLFNCGGSRNYKEEFLYDKVGFTGDRRPVKSVYESNAAGRDNKIQSLEPDANYYQGGYNYAPAPVRQVNTYGGSRFYSNPYAIPAAQVPQDQIPQGYYPGGYNNYRVYDADGFYVPPNSYRYIEKRDNTTEHFNNPSCDFGC